MTTTVPGAVGAQRTRIAVIEALSAGLGGSGHPDARLLQQGLAMRDAVAADLACAPGCTVGIAVGRSPQPQPASARVAEAVRPLPGDTLPSLVRRAAQAFDAVWVIAPETGGLLASACAATPPSRWIGCSVAAIDLAASKSTTLRRLQAAGVATPLACMATARQWVVKPDDGAGAEATRRHDHHDTALSDLAARTARGETAVLEPWVDGDALSLSLRCAAGGSVELLSVNRQQVEVDNDGHLTAHGVTIDVLHAPDPRHAAATQLARAVVAAMPGLRGFVGIDLVWHAVRGPVAIEVNPRTTSAYVGLSTALGRNLAAQVLADHLEAVARHAR